MEVRTAPNAAAARRMTTEEIRGNFLIESLFTPGAVTLLYSDVDRVIVGGAVPGAEPLPLLASKKEMAADYFCERREVGILNVGAAGTVTVDGKAFAVGNKDVLYVGRGSKEVLFSRGSDGDACFYIISYPAHKEYSTVLGRKADAEPQRLGTQETANKRTIYKYIHPNGIKSCQLVMGMTELNREHLEHDAVTHPHPPFEVYLDFDLHPEAFVVHLMGEPAETRNILIRDRQAVISPSWSIHSGAGTSNYSFVWAMGGENQEFGDMDVIPMTDLR